jgi:predicted oxidoreductase
MGLTRSRDFVEGLAMNTYKLGGSLEVSRIAQGCMTLSVDRREALATIRAALEGGITLFDHADVYGGGQREETFGSLWSELPCAREGIVLQSKCGIRPPSAGAPVRYDFGYEHIVEAVHGSLRRLRTSYLDVLLLHRPDALVEPEEVARAFDQLEGEGAVRHFGVSNHTAAQIRLLQRWVRQPLVANQLQLSLAHTPLLDEGIAMNRDDYPQPTRNEGTLEFCRLEGITVQAWSPLARGLLTGRPVPADRPYLAQAAERLARMAADMGVAPETLLIAWLLRHPAGILPVLGTTNPERIAAACRADALQLTRDEWYTLYVAGRGRPVP